MLFKIVLTTTTSVTIEAKDREEAEQKRLQIEREANAFHHHGEKTYAEIRSVSNAQIIR